MPKSLLLLLIACLIHTTGFGQKVIVLDGKLNGILPVNQYDRVSYQILQVAQGATKEELFKRGRKWINKTYNSSKDALQINDPVTGELSARSLILIPESVMGITRDYPIRHLMTLEVKEGKYRVTMTDFVLVGDQGDTYPLENIPYMGREWCDRFYAKVDQRVSRMLESLQKALATAEDF